eukprot:Hpha_TRINITY_DN6647_c0_g2::TRINITY_DN6647_c0_g2_i1::g.26510::m.26510
MAPSRGILRCVLVIAVVGAVELTGPQHLLGVQTADGVVCPPRAPVRCGHDALWTCHPSGFHCGCLHRPVATPCQSEDGKGKYRGVCDVSGGCARGCGPSECPDLRREGECSGPVCSPSEVASGDTCFPARWGGRAVEPACLGALSAIAGADLGRNESFDFRCPPELPRLCGGEGGVRCTAAASDEPCPPVLCEAEQSPIPTPPGTTTAHNILPAPPAPGVCDWGSGTCSEVPAGPVFAGRRGNRSGEWPCVCADGSVARDGGE